MFSIAGLLRHWTESKDSKQSQDAFGRPITLSGEAITSPRDRHRTRNIMPPKKLTGEKKKIVEDKTFGLKNKNKSAKVGRYVETVKNQAMHAGQSRKDMVKSSSIALLLAWNLCLFTLQRC